MSLRSALTSWRSRERRPKLEVGRAWVLEPPSSKTLLKCSNLQNKVKTNENLERSRGKTSKMGEGRRRLTLAENGEKARPFSAKGPFYSGWPDHVRGPNVPPHACHVRRPNLRFGSRTWTFLTYAFGGLKHSRRACMFGGRTWVFLQCYFHAETHFLSCLKHKTH